MNKTLEQQKKDFVSWFYEQKPYWPTPPECFDKIISTYQQSLPSKPVGEDATVTEQEMSSLRWLLNVSSEKPKTQLFTALDNCCDKEGISNRTHLESLWNKLKSGYAAAPQKGMGADDWGNGWDSAIRLANNLCVQVSDEYNNDDEIEQATAANSCALRVRKYLGDRSYKPESFPPDESPSPSEAGDGWVRVEDGLPEKRIRVIGWPDIGGYDMVHVDFDGIWKDDEGSAVKHPIVKWQPLPAPPIQKQ